MFRISEHTPYFGIRTDIVTFMVSPVSVAERAVVDIYRTKLVTCTGNFAYKDKRPVNLFYPYIRFARKTDACFAFIMRTVPKDFFIPYYGFLRQSVEKKTVVLFHDPKYDCSSIGIGES